MNVLAPTVALLGACLVALLTYELSLPQVFRVDAVLRTSQVADLVSPAPIKSNEANTAAHVETLLARPLFSQTRRAPSSASVAPSTANPLPRMTGILIDGPRRFAIFAAQTGIPGSKSTTIAEGGLIGPFTIRTIGPHQVIVTGPGGERTIHTSFDPGLQPPPITAATPVLYNLDAPKILNIAPGPSLLSRSLPSLQHAAPSTAF